VKEGTEMAEKSESIPDREVDPTNELLDGENVERKQDLLANEPVHVDETGRRLVHDDEEQIPPPASANLELRQRTEKLIEGTLASVGKTRDSRDSILDGLREERRGLQARAEDGDERAKKRVAQVDEQIKERESAAEKRSEASDSEGGRKSAPQGRSAKPKSES
jgi:hypothetical protein